jgi:tetraacyldisaccharide 4'-kinase
MTGSPHEARARREARWQAWAQHRGWPARLLWPLAQLLGAISALRRVGYTAGWLRSEHLPVPVIVVGNVVAGGAGKTPTVIALVQHLQHRGWRPGVVSRGHGRAGDALVQVGSTSAPGEVGDEPLLIHQTTGAPVCVARRRAKAARALLAWHPDVDVILCDDGLQHLALGRDLSIAVFDERGTGNGWPLPAGLLREPWPPAKSDRYRPDMLLVQRREGAPALELATGGIPRFDAQRRLADGVYNLAGEKRPLSALSNQPLTALAGIARPSVFFTMLRTRGLTLAQEIPLPDHANAAAYRAALTRSSGPLICTEKDAVKLAALLPDGAPAWRQRVWVAPLELSPNAGFFLAVDAALKRLDPGRKSRP